jgi:hypothetical protein
MNLQAVNLSIKDVFKYIDVLDKSLLDYHTQKMSEIN